MPIKDYYKTLQVEPSATQAEIKKAYRRLALEFHPDRNPGPRADKRFMEIAEAYDVLHDQRKRESYNYERWHVLHAGKKFESRAQTPETLLYQATELARYAQSLDRFRTDYQLLSDQVIALLDHEALLMLGDWDAKPVNRQIIGILLKVAVLVPARYSVAILDRLRTIASADPDAQLLIDRYKKDRRFADQWERFQLPVIVLITILICLLIFWVS